MITIRNIYKSFSSQSLFEGASLQINEGERFALVGPNGSGKSTLFKMMLREEEVDDGEIQFKKGVVVGSLPQENAPTSERTVVDETLDGVEDYDGRIESEAKAILMGLGFKVTDFTRKVNTLSGGWSMRVAMAKLLVKKPDLLLLDEPTNHLDLDSLLWLQEYLESYQGAIFVMNFLAQRQSEKDKVYSAWRQQQDDIAQMEDFIARNRARVSTASRVQSMIKRLDKLERIELIAETKAVKIRFPQPSRTGTKVLELRNISKVYNVPGHEPIKVYEGFDFELLRGQKMAFVGHNGAGKSTLLKLLAGVIEPDSGERVLGLNVKTGYFSQHREGILDPRKTVLQEAMDNDRMNPELVVRTVLGSFLFPGDNVHKKTSVLSGGEKSRLMLVKLLMDPPNVILMDEPTTHLDMASVDALVAALKEFEGTLCFISHDIYFINALADSVVHIEQGKTTVYPGNYDYFRYRQDQIQAENAGAKKKAAPAPAPKADSADYEEKKRQEAEARKKTRRAETLKKDIAYARKTVETLAAKMSAPEIHADYSQVKELGDKITALEAKIAAHTEELKALEAGEGAVSQ
ncbi:MAG: ABC transporter-related protein [Candidatus Magasanikbacteria bacterium GW2011_GWA2_37_8]|uniref:ABC transporter-related protein n=1 Tax=Candidatus Magasanikbacteria bacterium GW2011_GWA2_37_8 TaxID=1619036 RepID=A0A0G0KKT9_9BACT|nr:MAG: ABC transporter-related protein [Candidatus Magasanikbacteria bacterium GW2011_GWA2_37_8]